MVRKWSLTRTQLVVGIYIFLRDFRAKAWNDPKLQASLTMSLQEHFHAGHEETIGGKAKTTKTFNCSYCHGDYHKGGATKCPLKWCARTRARLLAKDVDKRIADEPDVLTTIIKEEQDRVAAESKS
jgi:hypothetical protein